MTHVVSSPLQVDRQRRTTLPSNVLAAAGIPAGSALMARVEEPGRIVLESPQLLLAQLQRQIAAGRAAMAAGNLDGQGGGENDATESPAPQLTMAEELLAERAAEAAAEEHEDADGLVGEKPADAGDATDAAQQDGRGSRA